MLHIRRCHVCGEVNESEKSAIDRCLCCGKHLAPFLFCKDVGLQKNDNLAEVQKTVTENSSSFLKAEYPPLFGISLYWS